MSPTPEAVVRLLGGVLPAGSVRSPEEAKSFRVPGSVPAAVVMPANEEELAETLRLASREGWGVIPAGHGAGLHLGNAPERADVILSTARLDGLADYEPADLTLTARSGTRLGSLQAELVAHGQFLPVDPPGAADATLGGIAAVGWGGSLASAFGPPRDHVLGMHAILADGTAVRSGGRVVKNVAGYDLHRLLVGSFGTLALLTAISLKVRPLPASDATVLFTADGWLPLQTFALRLLAEPWPLAACDLLSPSLSIRTGASERPAAALAVRAMGSPEATHDLLDRAAALATSQAIRESARLDGAAGEAFWKGLTQTEILADDLATVRVVAAPTLLSGVLGEAHRALPEGARIDFHAHATSGVARLFARGPEDRLAAWVASVRARAQSAHGHAFVERAPAALHIDAWGSTGSSAAIARRLKEAYDPRRVFSPGRFADGI
jgi:glycolate oxidase FAD binding subunit